MRLSSCKRVVSRRISFNVFSTEAIRSSRCSVILLSNQVSNEPHAVDITTSAEMNAEIFFTFSGRFLNLFFIFIFFLDLGRSIKTAHELGAKELILPRHTGSESLVRNLITKPQDELANAKRVNYHLLALIVLPSGFKQFLGRFWNVVQDFIVQLVVNRDWDFSNHCRAQLFRIRSCPMSALKQKMMTIRAVVLLRIARVPSFLPLLFRHNSHPLSRRFNVRGSALDLTQAIAEPAQD